MTLFYFFCEGESKKSVFIQAKLTSEVWNDDLLKDDSEAFKSMSELVSSKVCLLGDIFVCL